jgi:uncharacterized membrane protein
MSKGTKWLVAGLAVSLALNFLIIGFIAGHPGDGPRHEPPGTEFSLKDMGEALSPESQKILRETMREQRKELRPIFKERRQSRRAAGEILKADELDVDALKEAFARMRDADMALQAKIQNALADVAAQLPLEERAKMADWRRHMMERSFRGHRGERGDHGHWRRGSEDMDGPAEPSELQPE